MSGHFPASLAAAASKHSRSLKKGLLRHIHKADVRTPALSVPPDAEGGRHLRGTICSAPSTWAWAWVLTVPAEQADKALEILHANGEPEAYRLGVIAEGEGVELC